MREYAVAGCDLLRREYVDPAGDDECARRHRAERCASSTRCLLRWLSDGGSPITRYEYRVQHSIWYSSAWVAMDNDFNDDNDRWVWPVIAE